MITGTLAPVVNTGDLVQSFVVSDKGDRSLLDLSDVTIDLAIYRTGRGATLTASTSGGEITNPDTGVITVQLLAPRLRALCAGTWQLEMRASRAGFTTPFARFSLPVQEGVA